MKRREFCLSALPALGAASQSVVSAQGRRPLSRRLSVMIGGYFGRIPLQEKFQKLGSINYPACEGHNWSAADANLDEWRAQMDAAKLEVAHIGGSMSLKGPVGSLVDHAQHETMLFHLQRAVAAAKKLKTRRLLMLTGDAIPGRSLEDQHRAIVDGLREARKIAERENIILIVELLNTLVDHPGYYMDSTRKGMRIIDDVSSENVKLLNDLYHMQIMEGNLIQNIRSHIDHFGHFHVADVPGRHEPGTGEVNWRKVFEAIASTNYDGYVAMEYSPTIDPLESLKNIQKMVADL